MHQLDEMNLCDVCYVLFMKAWTRAFPFLSYDMNTHETTLRNKDNVYTTKYRSNQAGHAPVC